MEKDVTYQFDSYCGLYCGSCFVLLSQKDNRPIELIEPWSEWLKGMDLRCHGCKSEDVFENCKGCPRRPCAQAKGLDFCFQCEEYPCEIYRIASEKYHLAHHEVAQQKIKILEEQGIDAWSDYQSARWTCPNCGKMFSWYEKTCWNCEEPVLDSITEEQQSKTS